MPSCVRFQLGNGSRPAGQGPPGATGMKGPPCSVVLPLQIPIAASVDGAASVNCKQATLEPVEPIARPASLLHQVISGTSARATAGAVVVAAPTFNTNAVVANSVKAPRRKFTHVFCREWAATLQHPTSC